VYDQEFSHDLMDIVDRHGEDDLFTRFLTGPVFNAFDFVVRHFKVRHKQ